MMAGRVAQIRGAVRGIDRASAMAFAVAGADETVEDIRGEGDIAQSVALVRQAAH